MISNFPHPERHPRVVEDDAAAPGIRVEQVFFEYAEQVPLAEALQARVHVVLSLVLLRAIVAEEARHETHGRGGSAPSRIALDEYEARVRERLANEDRVETAPARVAKWSAPQNPIHVL